MQLKTFFRSPAPGAELASARVASYASWREASDVVAEAYRGWVAAPGSWRRFAYAAYMAALEREEQAALAYQQTVEQGRTA